MKTELYRILDANLNRSREGLRVCEEIARFVLNSAPLTKELKSMRHAIASGVRELPRGSALLLAARNSRDDVGRSSRLSTEMTRSNYRDLFIANMQRVKESLRVLEEFSKLCDIRIALRFQRLRFRAYEIEKKTVGRLPAGR